MTLPKPEKTPWYAEGLRFACTQCGNCCGGAPGFVWVNTEEVAAIAAFLDLSPTEFRQRHVRRAGRGYSLRELPNGDCEFLVRRDDGKTACRIHTVRPVQCRTWPFWASNLELPRSWDQTGEHCPGINQGALHALPVIQQALKDNGRRPL